MEQIKVQVDSKAPGAGAGIVHVDVQGAAYALAAMSGARLSWSTLRALYEAVSGRPRQWQCDR